MKVYIFAMMKEEIPDARQKLVMNALPSMGLEGYVLSARAGSIFEITIDNDNEEEVLAMAKAMAEKMLAHPIVEEYTVEIVKDKNG